MKVPFTPPSTVDRPFGCPPDELSRELNTPSDAYQNGFRDGFLGNHDMPPRFHALYEQGMVAGMVERRARAGVEAIKLKLATDVATPPE